MPEPFEDEPLAKTDLAEYWQIACRRHWYFLIPFLGAWLIAVLISCVLPPVYRSGTLILVEESTVPQQYVLSNVSGELQNRLDSITQQILSRTRLLHIVENLNLYAEERQHLALDDVVDRMRKDISIELVRSPGRAELTAFNVHFSAHDPRVAQHVTSELTNLFISDNIEVRQQQSESTTKFLDTQLTDARATLAEQERHLRDYKNRYLGELPGQLESNIQILSGLQNQLQAEQDSLGRAKQQNAYLESLLTQYRSAQLSSFAPGDVPTGLPAIDKELDQLRTQLADLHSRYTDDHPDVKKLREKIATTETLKHEIVADLKAKAEAQKNDPHSVGIEYVRNNQVSPLIEVQSQLKANELEIANRQETIKDLQGRIANYQGRLNQTPVREQQLADLSRDYEQSKTNYDSLLAKKNQSELATHLEKRQEGEHFRILDPPSLPTRPTFPNRLKVAGIGLFLGCVLGAVTVIGAEKVDDRIYAEKKLQTIIPAEVIVELPPLTTPAEQHTLRFRHWLNVALVVVVLTCILAGMAAIYLYG
jgi:protein tyrosine kinase modulator